MPPLSKPPSILLLPKDRENIEAKRKAKSREVMLHMSMKSFVDEIVCDRRLHLLVLCEGHVETAVKNQNQSYLSHRERRTRQVFDRIEAAVYLQI